VATTGERIGKNEAIFRDVNERIKEVSASFFALDSGELADFVCECSAEECHDAVSMSRSEYEAVRSDSRHFLVAPGHLWNAAHERRIAAAERFWVVEKLSDAGEVAEDEDPRG
jgi:hypothetical protein